MKALVVKPIYDWNQRKYMVFNLESKLITVKVPWRYGRVMAKTDGLKTLQSFKEGDTIDIEIEDKFYEGFYFKVLLFFKE